jgi:RNA polymerase sigma-70 factor (ECF subfamily)
VHDDTTARFERLFADHYPAIAGYLLRRCPGQQDAEDAAAEVFAIAWRRLDDLPPPPEVRLWLFGAARRVLANQQRAARRRDRLWHKLRDRSPVEAQAAVDPTAGGDVARALAALRASDRELLTLVAWEGLEVGEIARLLCVSSPVVSRRLYRARQRFAEALQEVGDGDVPGHERATLFLTQETTR